MRLNRDHLKLILSAIGITAIAVIERIYMAIKSPTINVDGPLYIYQAMELYYGLANKMVTCGLNHISPYPFLIAFVYSFVNDWVIAARLVSIILSLLLGIPLFFLLKDSFSKQISILTVCIVITIPTFSSTSVLVAKDAVAWFFLVLGLYSFQRYRSSIPSWPWAAGAAIFFTISAWARIEAAILFLPCFVFLLYDAIKTKHKQNFVAFSLAFVTIGILLCFLLISLDKNPFTYLRISDLWAKLQAVSGTAKTTKDHLMNIERQLNDITRLFISVARDSYYFLALISSIQKTVSAFFYATFLIWAVGIYAKFKKDKFLDFQTSFLCVSGISLFFTVLVNSLSNWCVDKRFAILFILTTSIFIGHGLRYIYKRFESKTYLTPKTMLYAVSLLIISFNLGKAFLFDETDKDVFRHLGLEIRAMTAANEEIRVLASPPTERLVEFYANLNLNYRTCPEESVAFSKTLNLSPEQIRELIKNTGVTYLIWEELYWNADTLEALRSTRIIGSSPILVGYHKDVGRIEVYRVGI